MADMTVEKLLGALGLQRATEPVEGLTVAMVVGLAIGALMGLLFAPESGKETLDNLRRQAREAVDDFAKATQKFRPADGPSGSRP